MNPGLLSGFSTPTGSSQFNDNVGDLIAMPDTSFDATGNYYVVRQDGREYLKTGTLRAYDARYTEFASRQGYTDQNYVPLQHTLLDGGNNAVIGASGYAYKFYYNGAGTIHFQLCKNSLTFYKSTTGLTGTWSSTAFGAGIYSQDSMQMSNGTVVVVNELSGGPYALSISSAGAVTQATGVTTPMWSCAVDAAGTLGVICGATTGTSGQIFTTTNGTAFTARTPSGGASSSNILGATWVPAGGGKFLYLTADNKAYTTTDGWTLTNVTAGLPAGYVCPFYINAGVASFCQYFTTSAQPSNCFASSPTATLFLDYKDGAATANLIRYDGTNFTRVTVPSWLRGGFKGALSYQDGKFWCALSGANAPVLVSDDDGLSWRPYSIHNGNAAAVATGVTGLHTLNSVKFVALRGSSGLGIYTYTDVNTLLTPNYIGHRTAFLSASGGVPFYHRIR